MHLMIDAATRESLEITQTMAGVRAGSLLGAIDRTVTGAGARLLGADLSAPLMDRHAIERRLALVQWYHDADNLRDRKSVVSGKRVSVGVDLGGRRIIKQKKNKL